MEVLEWVWALKVDPAVKALGVRSEPHSPCMENGGPPISCFLAGVL